VFYFTIARYMNTVFMELSLSFGRRNQTIYRIGKRR